MRVKIALADTYIEAASVRNEMKNRFPDKVFQVRKMNKGNQFMVVERTITKKDKKRGNPL